jgi:hypothetical protein
MAARVADEAALTTGDDGMNGRAAFVAERMQVDPLAGDPFQTQRRYVQLVGPGARLVAAATLALLAAAPLAGAG